MGAKPLRKWLFGDERGLLTSDLILGSVKMGGLWCFVPP